MNNELNKYGVPYLVNLESRLSQLLQPVRPDTEFVNTLKAKLTHVPTIVVETTKRGSKFLYVGLGVLAGIAAIWLIGKKNNEDCEE
jgi:hypothetical protein